jgi:hypothetical protein
MVTYWKSLPAALALCLAAAAAPLHAETGTITRILGGAVVELKVMPDSELQRVLVVTAEVSSGGWTDPELVPVTYAIFPVDGIWDVNLSARPPDGMAAQMISKLIFAMDASGEPDKLKGYRIHAASDCVVVLFDPKTELKDEKCVVLGTPD